MDRRQAAPGQVLRPPLRQRRIADKESQSLREPVVSLSDRMASGHLTVVRRHAITVTIAAGVGFGQGAWESNGTTNCVRFHDISSVDHRATHLARFRS